jgi:hypothetical protein
VARFQAEKVKEILEAVERHKAGMWDPGKKKMDLRKTDLNIYILSKLPVTISKGYALNTGLPD